MKRRGRPSGTISEFASERPEEEQDKGPDGLWAMRENHYLVTEVKNEVELTRTRDLPERNRADVEQANWFEKEYGKGVPVTLLMIHPTADVADSAYPPAKMMVMTLKKLECLHAKLRRCATALSSKAPESWIATEIGTSWPATNSTPEASARTTECRRRSTSPMPQYFAPAMRRAARAGSSIAPLHKREPPGRQDNRHSHDDGRSRVGLAASSAVTLTCFRKFAKKLVESPG